MPATPSTRPKATRVQWERAATRIWRRERPGQPLPPAYVVAAPGYYLDSMGKAGENDRGINDDGYAVLGPEIFATFNGNTDPSIYRSEIATLKPGQVIDFIPGRHAIGRATEHDAYRQASSVIVRRDGLVKPKGYVHPKRGISLGDGYWTDAGYPERFWTNLHKQQRNSTSSEGCLTIPWDQWDAFYALVKQAMKRAGIKKISVILLEGAPA